MDKTPETVKPVAVCESCFIMDHARWEPESMDDTGNILMRLVGVDVPIKINNGTVEVCGLCGGLTISGIYEFKSSEDIIFEDNGDNSYELELPSFDFGDDFD
jgi:hypothetical protein